MHSIAYLVISAAIIALSILGYAYISHVSNKAIRRHRAIGFTIFSTLMLLGICYILLNK